MSRSTLGKEFPLLFAAATLQEVSFALLIHLPGYLTGLGVTESSVGALYAVGAVASLLFRPAFGRILDLSRRRSVLLVIGLANSLIVLSFVTTDIWGPYLWILFLIQRGLQVALFTTMLTYAADAIPIEHRTQGLAIFGLSGLIPIALGGVAGDVVIDVAGFDGLFVCAAGACLIAWVINWRLAALPVLGRQPRRGFWHALAQRDLLPLWLITLCLTVGLETLFTFTRTFVDARHVGSTGLFFGLYGTTAAIVRIFGRHRYDLLPLRPLLVALMTLYGASFLVLAAATNAALLAVSAIMAGLAHGGMFPILSSQVVNRARAAERGSAVAIFTSIFDVALISAAPATGSLIDHRGYLTAFACVGVTLIIGAATYGVWDRRAATATIAAD